MWVLNMEIIGNWLFLWVCCVEVIMVVFICIGEGFFRVIRWVWEFLYVVK